MPDSSAVLSLNCPICHKHQTATYASKFYWFESKFYDLVQCVSCRLVYVEPMPDQEIVKRMYGDEYFQKDFISDRYEGDYEEIYRKRQSEFREILEMMESRIPKESRALFEVGTAGGAFLRAAREHHWQVSGLEISEWGTKYANEKYQLDVRRGNYLETDLTSIKMPVIFFGDVFEHFTDPVFALQKLNALVEGRGYVVMMLPMYVSSWTFRLFRSLRGILAKFPLPASFKLLLKLEINQENYPPYHVFEYSKNTIRKLLEQNGYRILLIKGNLPIPESLQKAAAGEGTGRKLSRLMALALYRVIKFSSENFNFPLVRAIVIAQRQ